MEKDRYLGCIMIGLAVGDALGTTLRFKKPVTFKPIKGMMEGGLFALKAGEWTETPPWFYVWDQSLIGCKGFDPADYLFSKIRKGTKDYLMIPFRANIVPCHGMSCVNGNVGFPAGLKGNRWNQISLLWASLRHSRET